MMTRCIMIDLDNTLSDASWREHMAGVDDWEKYHAEGANDKANAEIRELIRNYTFDNGEASDNVVIVMSERPERWRQMTVKWLSDNLIWPDEVYMRPADNKMKVPELKVWFAETMLIDKILVKDRLSLVIDDNERVIDAFNAIGIPGLHYRGRTNNRG